jgi:hypothetical protein
MDRRFLGARAVEKSSHPEIRANLLLAVRHEK